MCGIAGLFDPRGLPPVADVLVRRMLNSISYRGPDEFGMLVDDCSVLGSARLSIVDLAHGQQPITNEDETLWIVYNGEVFNHPELRAELTRRGHRFTTATDTEVILHLYEDLGADCLAHLNGQFALAIWNTVDRTLFLARDRLGVRPLFYRLDGQRLVFGSEIKAVLNGSANGAELDHRSLVEVFTYWAPQSSRTAFRSVEELPPGHFLLARPGGVTTGRYWQPDFAPAPPQSEAQDVDALEALLVDATRLRLRADVPIGAYLSGGLDSSLISALARQCTQSRLLTFSIAFTDARFDERPHQERMAATLGTDHHVIEATHEDIGRVFPEVLWHAEVPLLRTSPAPMYLLSKLVQQNGIKVVLSGEGADEILAGYDIFKEAKVRRFWARQPESRWRPLLLQRLYPDVFGSVSGSAAFITAFFREGLTDVTAPTYSHAIRWRNTRRAARFLREDILASAPSDDEGTPRIPPEFAGWDSLERAQFLEMTTFLSPYLLSSQGDRMAMAHSVEGRFPFLDHRVVDFACRLNARRKLRGLTEKHVLRRVAARWLPGEVAQRTKHPYRAPIHRSFFNASTPAYVREVLAPSAIERSGLFKPAAVRQLVAKVDGGGSLGETDDMALAGIISTQLIQHLFVDSFRAAEPIREDQTMKIRRIGRAAERQP